MVKNPRANAHRRKRHRFDPRVGAIPWRRARQSTPVILPGESHVQRSLAGYSPWGRTESDTTEATARTRAAAASDLQHSLIGIQGGEGRTLLQRNW